MNIYDLLRAEAKDINQEFEDHDPAQFTRDLIRRVAEEGGAGQRPAALGRRHPAPTRPAPGPAASARAVAGAGVRPRAADGDPEALLTARARTDRWLDLQQLCAAVAADPAPGSADGGGLMEAADSTWLACQLYRQGCTRQAVFWWKFAVGADEDLLAAHLLADYYAVLGKDVAARGWHEFLGLLLEDSEPAPPAAESSPVLPDLVSKLLDSCSPERDCANLEQHDGLEDVLQAFVADSSGAAAGEEPVQAVGRLVTSRAGRRRSRSRGWLPGLHTGREPSRRRPPSAKDG